MKHLVIIGGGGMGRAVYCMAKESLGFLTDFDIKGFLDDNIHSMDGFDGYPPILDTISDYAIESDDIFVCSIGDVNIKHKICEGLKSKGAKFYTLVNSTARIHQNVILGDGCIIGAFATVGADASVGENCLIQSFASIGHDCKIGNYVRMDTRSMCVGGVIVEDLASIFTMAVCSHNVVVGRNARVSALSFVIRKVKPGTTVFGNPAKLL
jgi:sugar O-acyltransferase (sialic acid O-acetyltransferase NeuD family)